MPNWESFEAYQAHLNNGIAVMVWLALVGTVISYNAPIPRRLSLSYIPRLPIAPPPLWITLGIALFLRSLWLNQSLWYDETFTLNIIRNDLFDMPPIVVSDVHPIGGYLLIWLSTQLLGLTEAAMRAPSLLFGLGSIWIIARIALNLDMSQRAARWAALIMALAPLHIYQSTEARAYAALLFLFLWSFNAILENKPGRFIVAGLMPHMHAVGFIYLAALWFLAILRCENIRRWILPLIAAPAIGSIYAPIALLQSSDVRDGFWNGQFSIGDALSYTFDAFFWRRYGLSSAIIIYGIALPYSFMSLWVTRNWKHAPLLLCLYLGIPIMTALVSIGFANIYLERTLFPAGMLIILYWIKAAPPLPRWFPVAMGGALLLATVWTMTQWDRGELRENSQYCRGADFIYTQNNAMAISWSAYLDNVILWNDPARNDLVQYLSNDAIETSQFFAGNLENYHGDICIIANISPLNNARQIQHLKWITQTYKPYWSKRVVEYPHYIIDIYRIRI